MAAGGTTGQGPALASRITVEDLDHVVLTVADVEASLGFYRDVLGMRAERSEGGGHSLHVGSRTVCLRASGQAQTPAATPGGTGLCFITSTPVEGLLRLLAEQGHDRVEGPVERPGAAGNLLSVLVRDPDGNLVELANRLDS